MTLDIHPHNYCCFLSLRHMACKPYRWLCQWQCSSWPAQMALDHLSSTIWLQAVVSPHRHAGRHCGAVSYCCVKCHLNNRQWTAEAKRQHSLRINVSESYTKHQHCRRVCRKVQSLEPQQFTKALGLTACSPFTPISLCTPFCSVLMQWSKIDHLTALQYLLPLPRGLSTHACLRSNGSHTEARQVHV